MGIHHWIGYVRYKESCVETLKHNLDTFCFSCHTPDDVNGCNECKIGQVNDMMIQYLEKDLKDKKYFDKLYKIINEEDDYYKYIRLRSHFRPKRPSKKYLYIINKENKYFKNGFKVMLQIWASNRQECDRIRELLDKIKKSRSKY